MSVCARVNVERMTEELKTKRIEAFSERKLVTVPSQVMISSPVWSCIHKSTRAGRNKNPTEPLGGCSCVTHEGLLTRVAPQMQNQASNLLFALSVSHWDLKVVSEVK